MDQPVLGCEYYTLNVFTKERFGGNPLAVVVGADHLNDQQMQQIAREFNLSETIFLQRAKSVEHTAKVRIFTPTQELPFAGHPTIGAAILLSEMGADLSVSCELKIQLEEVVGLVDVSVSRTRGQTTFAQLEAPRLPTEIEQVPSCKNIAKALGISTKDIGYGLHRPSAFEAGNAPLFLPVKNREVLSKLDPNASHWKLLDKAGSFGVYAFCRGKAQSESFHARFFAPETGIVEDPATGSAVVAFAGALNKGLLLEDGNHAWTVHQGEDMGRPSELYLELNVADGKLRDVRVGGYAVRVARGVLQI